MTLLRKIPDIGHKTLREHGAVCPTGYRIEHDETGDEVCRPDPSATPYVVVEAPPTVIYETLPYRGGSWGPRPHRRPHMHGLLSLGAATVAEVENFRTWAREARVLASQGQFAPARSAAEAARGFFLQMGSPPAYKDELDYALLAAYGDESALADIESSSDLLGRARVNARPVKVSFLDDLGGELKKLQPDKPTGIAAGAAGGGLLGALIGGLLGGKRGAVAGGALGAAVGAASGWGVSK